MAGHPAIAGDGDYQQIERIGRDILRHFILGKKHARFYPPGHPVLTQSMEVLRALLAEYLMEYSPISLNFYDGQLFVLGVFLPEETKVHAGLIREMEDKELTEVTFLPGADTDELMRFFRTINLDEDAVSDIGGYGVVLQQEDVSHVLIAAANPSSEDSVESPDVEGDGLSSLTRETYLFAVEVVQEIARDVLSGRPASISGARRVVDAMVDSVLKEPDTILRLSVLKNYDEYTFFHSVNVLVLSLTIGGNIGLDRPSLSALGMGALLHDIGKVKIPLDILQKRTALTPEEWEIVKRHPIEGADIALSTKGVHKISGVVALEHHYGYDRRGYPSLVLDAKPHLFSRIVEIGDVYDALTSKRSYRQATIPDNALRMIYSQSGKKFDPLLTKAFVKIMGLYPVGSVVKLNSGEFGVVIRANREDLIRPTVKVVLDANRGPIEPFVVDLALETKDGGFRTTILEAVNARTVGIDVEKHVL